MADEDPVDPKKELEDRCKAPCTRPLKEYLHIFVGFETCIGMIQHCNFMIMLRKAQMALIQNADRPLFDRHVLKEFKAMNLGTSTVPGNILIIGAVLTNALQRNCLLTSNNRRPDRYTQKNGTSNEDYLCFLFSFLNFHSFRLLNFSYIKHHHCSECLSPVLQR